MSMSKEARARRRADRIRDKHANDLPRSMRPNAFVKTLTIVVLVLVLIYFLFPIYWAIIASTKTPSQLTGSNGLWFAVPLNELPGAIADNYATLLGWTRGQFWRWVGNSLLYSCTSALIGTIVSVMAGYATAKFNFRGKGGGNWQGGGSLGSENTPVGGDTPGISTDLSSGGALLSTIYTHGSDYFMASINALESENAARMLGRPSVLTVDNVEAVLENTTTYYIPLRGQEAVDLYRVEAGTVLRVTPHIIHEGGKTSIKLAVSVQDDQNDASSGYQTVGESGDTLTVNPIKQTRINTQAMVEAGQSLLIGGYYYEQKSEGDSGVPILKDIPILGHLFKSSSTSGRQMERLILITPRIVTADGDNVPARVNQPGFGRNATGADYEWKALPQADASADKADGEG